MRSPWVSLVVAATMIVLAMVERGLVRHLDRREELSGELTGFERGRRRGAVVGAVGFPVLAVVGVADAINQAV